MIEKFFITLLGIIILILGVFKPIVVEELVECVRDNGFEFPVIDFLRYWGGVVTWRSCCVSGVAMIVAAWTYDDLPSLFDLSNLWDYILAGCISSPFVLGLCMLIIEFIALIVIGD
jgi:hypothetical protein